jgi:hypothetical protein
VNRPSKRLASTFVWVFWLSRYSTTQPVARLSPCLPDPDPPKPTKPTRTRKPRPKKQRTFTITFAIDGTDYRVYPLACDPSIGHKACRFCKQGGNGEIYDLHADAFRLHCQCRGYEVYGHCKRMETVQAAGKVFNLLAG